MASHQILAIDEESQTESEVNTAVRGKATSLWIAALTIAGCAAIAFAGLGFSSGGSAFPHHGHDVPAHPTAGREAQQVDDGVRALMQPDATELASGMVAMQEVPSVQPVGASPSPQQAARTEVVAKRWASARGGTLPTFAPLFSQRDLMQADELAPGISAVQQVPPMQPTGASPSPQQAARTEVVAKRWASAGGRTLPTFAPFLSQPESQRALMQPDETAFAPGVATMQVPSVQSIGASPQHAARTEVVAKRWASARGDTLPTFAPLFSGR